MFQSCDSLKLRVVNFQVVRDVLYRQRRVAIISEMIHTSSLVHDDVLDHAEMRLGGKPRDRFEDHMSDLKPRDTFGQLETTC